MFIRIAPELWWYPDVLVILTIMKEISPWNVDDVDDHTRELALNAAQKAGLTLGAWIDRAIKISTGLTLDERKPDPSNTISERFLDNRGENFDVVEPAEGAEED